MRQTRILMTALVGLALLCQSCSIEERTTTPIAAADNQSASVTSLDLKIQSDNISLTEKVLPRVMARRSVSYLEEIIPPCVPFEGSKTDPCSLITLPKVEASVGATTTLLRVVPTFTDILYGEYSISSSPHIVVRGTVKPNTTRCELYPVKNFSYEEPDDYFDRIKLFHNLCFVDVRINEYIVGIGPPELTVSVYRQAIWPLDPEEWPNIKDEYETAAISNTEFYEEKEMVLFLETPLTSAVEAWRIGSILFDTWFVQRNGDDIRAVSSAMSSILEGYNDELRDQMDLSLDELIRQVKEAAENRLTRTGGRIGAAPGLPMFVTDANKLQDFYQQTGAVYEGEGATLLPPPVPGGRNPSSLLPGPVRHNPRLPLFLLRAMKPRRQPLTTPAGPPARPCRHRPRRPCPGPRTPPPRQLTPHLHPPPNPRRPIPCRPPPRPYSRRQPEPPGPKQKRPSRQQPRLPHRPEQPNSRRRAHPRQPPPPHHPTPHRRPTAQIQARPGSKTRRLPPMRAAGRRPTAGPMRPRAGTAQGAARAKDCSNGGAAGRSRGRCTRLPGRPEPPVGRVPGGRRIRPRRLCNSGRRLLCAGACGWS